MTIYDLAKKLDVSPATVSMALSGDPKVAERTRLRVRKLAAKCGFTPSESARNFRLKRSSMVAVVVHDIASGFWAGALKAIERGLGESHSVVVCNTDGDLEKERNLVKTLVGRRISGLIIAPAAMRRIDHLVELDKSGVPVVLLERTDDAALSFVKGDDYGAARMAVEEFVKDGRRRIAMLAFRTGVVGAHDRVKGFEDAIAGFGLSQSCRVFPDDDAVGAFIREAESFDAALCLNDSLVPPLLKGLDSVALRVPDDIAVVSWDNSVFLDYLAPPVCSFSIPMEEMGLAAAEVVKIRLAGGTEVVRKLIPEAIFHRRSCGRPK